MMKTQYKRTYHQRLHQVLQQFNSSYLNDHCILFGGGTRIALELDEYRQSVDIDFFCVGKNAFRAVRSVVTETTLGDLVRQDFNYPRDIRADRDAVRCFISDQDIVIKLEFVFFLDELINADTRNIFPVPAIDRTSCYLSKLLANADRYNTPPYKDIFDLLAMFDQWGEIPQQAWHQAEEHYGKKAIWHGLEKAYRQIKQQPQKYSEIATQELDISLDYAQHLLNTVVDELYQKII